MPAVTSPDETEGQEIAFPDTNMEDDNASKAEHIQRLARHDFERIEVVVQLE